MEKVIVLNHKMNMDYNEIKQYIKLLKQIDLNPIVFPTSIYLSKFIENGISTGIQNIYYQNKGSYTGEVSPSQAKSLGVDYTLIGHFERKKYFGETNSEINKKVKIAIENDLKVILCIGERENEDYRTILKSQIEEGLKGITKEVIIAYEPVWSIGSDKTPNKEEIEEIIKYIKSLFNYNVTVLYGGSVDKNIIQQLKEVNVVSGFIIGRKSTDIHELIKIKEVVS